MTEVIVLDVGHGNGALVKSTDAAAVIDAPLGSVMLEALEMENVRDVVCAIASHSDADHLGGLITMLLSPDVHVREVRCNPDAIRRSVFWDDFKIACKMARRLHGTRLRTELTTESTPDLDFGDFRLEVVFPVPELAVGGVGSNDEEGREVTTNAMSAVVRVTCGESPVALFTGDLDLVGLNTIEDEGTDIRAEALVFPHHGGLPGRGVTEDRLREFAARLVRLVDPATVVFSLSRVRFTNPQPAVVEGVRQGAPHASIACTQLSRRCSDESLPSDVHLSTRFAHGRRRGHCCAGTLVFTGGGRVSPTEDDHQVAIVHLQHRLCG